MIQKPLLNLLAVVIVYFGLLAIGPSASALSTQQIYETADASVVVIKTYDFPAAGLQLASRGAKVGQEVVVIGSPEGLEKSVSPGVVSGLREIVDRNLTFHRKARGRYFTRWFRVAEKYCD